MNWKKVMWPFTKLMSLILISVQIPISVHAQWENPVIDTITSTQVRKETTLQSLCLDDSAMVHLVWKHQRPLGWRIFYCTNSPSGTWGAVQEVGDSLQPNYDPGIVWSPAADEPFIVYEQDNEIYFAHLSGSAWQIQPITVNSQPDRSATVAIDITGIVHAAWITDDPISSAYKIGYASGDAGGWSVQTLAGSELGPYGSGASPFIAVTSEGLAHIVYRGGDYGNYHIHHAWNDSAGSSDWNYEILYSGNVNDFSAAMVVDGDGDLHVAVSGNDGWGFPGRVYYFHKPHGQVWEQYELASLTYSAVEPSLDVDNNGTPHIVWMETSGNFYTGNIFYSGRVSSGTWAVSMVIGGDHFSPSFEIDQGGYGHVACHTGGNTSIYDIYHVKSSGVLTCVEEFGELSSELARGYLLATVPNPVRTQVKVSYYVTMPGYVRIKVYDSIGQEVAKLVNEFKPCGAYSVVWQPEGLSTGIYFISFVSGRPEKTMKCVLLP